MAVMKHPDRILLAAKAEELDALQATLDSLDYNVCCTATSAKALTAAADTAVPDLALIDLGVKGAANAAWTVSINLRIPVVYLIAADQLASFSSAQAADPLGYVLKPYESAQLQLTLDTCLATRARLAKPRSATRFPQAYLLETIFQSVNEGVAVVNTNGHIRYANSAAGRLVGMSDVQTAERDLTNFRLFALDGTTPLDWEESPPVRAILYGEASENCEAYVMPPNQNDGIAISMDTAPLYDEEGRRYGCLIVFRDISEQKRTERELRATAARLERERNQIRLILDSVGEGVLVTDRSGRVIVYNAAGVKMLGRPEFPGEVISPDSDFDWLLRPDGKTPFPTKELPILKALNGIPSDHVEMYAKGVDGEGVHMNVSARPILDDSGEVFASVAVVRDVTALKKHEDDLRETAEELAERTQVLNAMFEALSDGIILMDANDNVVRFNSAAQEILTPELIRDMPLDVSKPDVGIYFADRVTPVPPDELPNRAAFRGESRDQMRFFIVHPSIPDGVLVSVSTGVIGTPGEASAGVVLLFHDVTEEYKKEQALSQAFDAGHLEATSTVLHNVGNALNSAATGIESLRERLRARRPLNRLSAVAEALKAHREDWVGYLRDDPQGRQAIPFLLALNEEWKQEYADVQRILERTAARVEHIAGILRAQQSAGLPSTQRKIVPLKKAVWDGVRLLESSLQRRGIAIRVDCTRAPHEIDIHESRFHQMLVNLLRNGMEAIKEWSAEEPGHRPAVSITGYVEDGHLFLDVADNGVGIDAENLGEVFSPGYTTKEGGSGLGLHSVANYVIDSGGGIEALSEGRGLGATIRVHWPLRLRVPKSGNPPLPGNALQKTCDQAARDS